MSVKKCTDDFLADNDVTALIECAKDLGKETLECFTKCQQKHTTDLDDLKDCVEDCGESNGAQGIQATQFTMLLVSVFAMFMVAKIIFKWRVNSF